MWTFTFERFLDGAERSIPMAVAGTGSIVGHLTPKRRQAGEVHRAPRLLRTGALQADVVGGVKTRRDRGPHEPFHVAIAEQEVGAIVVAAELAIFVGFDNLGAAAHDSRLILDDAMRKTGAVARASREAVGDSENTVVKL